MKYTYSELDDIFLVAEVEPNTGETGPLPELTIEQKAKIRAQTKQQEFTSDQKFMRGTLFAMFLIGGWYITSALGSIDTAIESPPPFLLILIGMAALAIYLLQPERYTRNGEALRQFMEKATTEDKKWNREFLKEEMAEAVFETKEDIIKLWKK